MVSISSTLNATSRTPSPCRERCSDISSLSGSYGDSNTNTIYDYTILMIRKLMRFERSNPKFQKEHYSLSLNKINLLRTFFERCVTFIYFTVYVYTFMCTFKITHFVLYDNVRGYSSATSFQTAICIWLKSHSTSIVTGSLQAIVFYFHV